MRKLKGTGRRQTEKQKAAVRESLRIRNGDPKPCRVKGCHRTYYRSSLKLCAYHRGRRYAVGEKRLHVTPRPARGPLDYDTPCSGEGCPREIVARFGDAQYCPMHYQRAQAGTEINRPVREHAPRRTTGAPCRIPGCKNLTSNARKPGLCNTHGNRQTRERQGRRTKALTEPIAPQCSAACQECGRSTRFKDEGDEPLCKRCVRELSTPAKPRSRAA